MEQEVRDQPNYFVQHILGQTKHRQKAKIKNTRQVATFQKSCKSNAVLVHRSGYYAQCTLEDNSPDLLSAELRREPTPTPISLPFESGIEDSSSQTSFGSISLDKN